MYAIGLDYGTNSVRAIVAECQTGAVLGSGIYEYAHGTQGIIGDLKILILHVSILLTI